MSFPIEARGKERRTGRQQSGWAADAERNCGAGAGPVRWTRTTAGYYRRKISSSTTNSNSWMDCGLPLDSQDFTAKRRRHEFHALSPLAESF